LFDGHLNFLRPRCVGFGTSSAYHWSLIGTISFFSSPASKECVMLVLTRKHQEQIRIGDNVTLTILRVKGNTVKVGIEAPRDVRVVRGELPPKEPQLTAKATEPGEPCTVRFTETAHSEAEAKAEENAADSNRLGQLVRQRKRLAAVVAHAV
jgi:carbon storage regulator CsrA